MLSLAVESVITAVAALITSIAALIKVLKSSSKTECKAEEVLKEMLEEE